MSLEGRVAVVTGASRGIGEHIARRLAAEGAAVAVTARTAEDGDHVLPGGVGSVVRSIVDGGGTALAVIADLSRAEDRERVVRTTEDELGPVDILVNNAAVTYFSPVESFSERHWRLMFEVQVRAPFELSQLVLPGMRQRRRGWILNISSRAGMHPKGPPYPGGSGGGGTVYGMVKAALERFTTGLASEVWADGVAVNVLSPSGLVVTPGVKHHHLDERVPEAAHEPMEVMVAAAHALVTGDPATLTGRIAYSQELVRELGL